MRKLACICFAASAVACGGAEVELGAPDHTFVVRTLELAREEPRGVAIGFDLDGFVSGSNDRRGCGKADFTSPEGTPGVDNELARLLPLIDLAGEGALQGLVQDAVNEGRLLMFFEVFDLDEGQARLRVRRGEDTPLLGTDGRILPGQTLALHPEAPLLGEAEATFDGRVVEAGPMTLRVPLVVFSQLYEIELPEGRVRLELDAEGRAAHGTVGGGIPIAQLRDVLDTASNFGPEFQELFGDAVEESGDLAHDDRGQCTQMSAGLAIEAAPAFVWE